MSSEHKCLERQHKRLQSKDQRVHQTQCIDDVKSNTLQDTRLFLGNLVMVVGVGVGETSAARGYAFQPAFVERLKSDQESARFRDLLRFEQSLAATKLPGGDKVLHVGHDHRDDSP